jgi:hypothetical protein
MKHVFASVQQIKELIENKKNGIDCSEEESCAIKRYIHDTLLVVGNGSIDIDEELQQHFPLEWGEAQDWIEADFGGYEN